ncbi:hypothetical protein V6N13_064391 [Hibiscus sabdariffa]|uniref:Uncharacterized protein n=1 Tax=Hibiscus sabdariffa TaxID=183260 RepID=A0ABR2E9X7_9ROSI
MYSTSKFVSLVKKLWMSKPKQCSYDRLPGTDVEDDVKAVQTRRGYVAIYVGQEAKRFEVPIKYLSCVAFQELLNRSHADDLDAKIDGPITVVCSSEMFKKMLKEAKHHFI